MAAVVITSPCKARQPKDKPSWNDAARTSAMDVGVEAVPRHNAVIVTSGGDILPVVE